MRLQPFASFFLARTVGILGDRVADLALPLAILATTGSAARASVVAAVAQLPQIVGALHIGAFVDRRNRRTVMATADILRAMAYVLVGLEVTIGEARWVPLVLLALVIGMGDALFYAAAAAVLPSLVRSTELVRANGFLEAADAGATLAGPPLAGWLLQRFSPLVAFAFNAASFVASALFLIRLPRGDKRAQAVADGPSDSVQEGFRLIVRDKPQRRLLAASIYMHLLAASVMLAVLVHLQADLQMQPATIGLIVSAAGVGGLLASLVLSRFVAVERWQTAVAAALFVNAGAAAVIAVTEPPVLLAILVLLLDGASAFAFIVTAAARQRITPDGALGRVTSASIAFTATTRLMATAAIGVLLDLVGPQLVLGGLAVIGIPFILLLVLPQAVGAGRAASSAETRG
jgi:predicted MFS family arabinose efflux permease